MKDGAETGAPAIKRCWLCERPMGAVTEWHHPVPKSRKGRDVVRVHPICHQAIHANFSNAELHRIALAVERLREHAQVAKFLAWVANKDPDFHARTASRRR